MTHRNHILFVAIFIGFCAPLRAQWSIIPSGTTDSLTALTWVEGRFLIAGGSLRFLRSFDNGISFSATDGYAPGFFSAPLDMLAFHDSLVGYGTNRSVCCTFQRTLDGGLTWEGWAPPGPADDRIVMRLPVNGTDQVIFKNGAAVRFAADGTLLDEPNVLIQADLDSVCPEPGSGNCMTIISGEDTTLTTSSYGWTLTSNDRGANIQTGTFPYSSYFYSAHVINGDTIAFVEYGGHLLVSHDGGISWNKRSQLPHQLSNTARAFRMFSASKGAAWGDDAQIHLTLDSGSTWFPVNTPSTHPLNDILFLDQDHVLAIGEVGTILASSDGGFTWEEEESGTTSRLHALGMSENAVVAVGSDGVILRRYPAWSGLSTGLSAIGPKEFRLYPNPSSAFINVHHAEGDAPADQSFTSIDPLGRKHRLQTVANGTGPWTLDITQLPSGVHTLVWDDGRTERIQRFVVAR